MGGRFSWRRGFRDEFVLLVEGEVEDEFVVDLEQHFGLHGFSRSRESMRIMASLIMSAAVPWMGVLMAARSALPRMFWLPELRSGKIAAAAGEGFDVAGFAGLRRWCDP